MKNSDIYANKSQFKSDHNLDSILEPLSLESPMDVPNLVVKFSEEVWQEFGNTVSDEYLELWSIIFSKLNECDIRNRQSEETYNKYFVIPAPTGSGKTQCFRFYAAELARQNQDVGMVILSRFKSEVDESVKQINELAGNKVAIAYYSGTEVKDQHNEVELDCYQVVVTTHEYFKLNHHNNAVDKDTFRKVMSFNGHTRDIMVVDEAIDLLDTHIISKDLVAILETKAFTMSRKTDSPKLKLELELLTYLNDNYKSLFFDDNIGAGYRYVNDKLPTLKRVSLKLNVSVDTAKELFKLDNFIKAIKSKQLERVDLITSAQKTKLINNAKTLIHLLDDSLYWYNNQKYISSSLERPTVSTVLFDATANIDKLYKSIDYVTVVKPLPEVKRYDNVFLHYIELGIGLGKDNIDNNTKSHFDNLTYLYRNIKQLNFEDSIVVFTRKSLRGYAEQQEIPSDIDHFGNLVGVNLYKDDNQILIYGIPYKPKSLHINNLYQASGSEVFNSESDAVLAILAHTNISAEIVQAVNRGRCRKVVNGQAPETHIYLPLAKRDKQLNEQILSDIKKAMPGIQIMEWDIDISNIKGQNKQEVNSKFNLLVDNIKSLKEEKVKLSYLEGYGTLSDKEKRTVAKHLMDKASPMYAETKGTGYKCIKEGQYYLVKN